MYSNFFHVNVILNIFQLKRKLQFIFSFLCNYRFYIYTNMNTVTQTHTHSTSQQVASFALGRQKELEDRSQRGIPTPTPCFTTVRGEA